MRNKHFDQEIYRNVSISDLIIFTIYLVIEGENKCDFEKLISQAFILFPKTFSFEKIPKWPDSRKFDRQLRTLRRKKLIIGKPSFFSLTKKGEKKAKEVAKVFSQERLKL